jgi:rsbT co-antagonist protein RsbR
MKHECQVAIIDVTGIFTMDANATNHLLHAAKAARLLGTHVLLVGIRSEVAMVFARDAAQLGDIPTLADLTQGLSYALGLCRKQRTIASKSNR